MTPELIALLLAAIVGVALAMLLDRRAAGSLLAGEALLVGIGAASGALLALSVAGVLWTRVSLVIVLGGISVCAWIGVVKSRRPEPDAITPRHPATFAIHALTIVLVAGFATLATLAPLWEFDFIGDWGLKARTFFAAGGIDWPFLEHPFHYDVHPDYPPLLPLAFDVFAVMRGAWNDATLGLLSVAFAAALLLVVNRVAREETESSITAAAITAAMVPFACSPWIGLAEGPFVAYATTALLLLRRGSVAAGAVMLGLAASTKNEGLSLIVAIAIALVAARRARDLIRLWPAVVIPLPWLILRHLHALQTDLAAGNPFVRIIEHLREPGPLLDAFRRYGAGKPLLWISLAFGIVLIAKQLVKLERFVMVALAMQFLFYIGAYLATPHDIDWHVRWSWERLISHLAPALTYVVLVRLLAREAPATVEGSLQPD
ncbi:MAG: hypothetical protein QOK37_4658 [Thermoanaerobaculia bacterium]|nr:hypothetical protein [Thermoanaerobaculia bacterium]